MRHKMDHEVTFVIMDVSDEQRIFLGREKELAECSGTILPGPRPSVTLNRKDRILYKRKIQEACFYRRKKNLFLVLNSYLVGKFLSELVISGAYRKAWLQTFLKLMHKNASKVFIFEILPAKFYLDYSWGHRLEYLCQERMELENTMSWLSTLGGAFSALGDDFERCAKIAGRISVEQFHLASRLGDPDTQARCRLYLALSLLQQGKLRCAKRIVQREYRCVTSVPLQLRDIRLVKMCLGIWAKLKYLHSLRVKQKTQGQK